MGRTGCVTKARDRRQSPRVTKKLLMATKEQLSAMPKPDYHKRQDILIKVLRSLRRKSHYEEGARPIFYKHEVLLSPLYKEDINEKDIYQVFSDVSKFGQGCFGDVFRACWRDDSTKYAIMVTNDTHAFVDHGEVRRLEKISEHENFVKFFMVWQETYRLYTQMELCRISLDKVLMVYHHIEERQCWEIFLDVAQRLKHLYDNMLIYLDIKPANIMITSTGICKIGDFSLLVDLQEESFNTGKKKPAMPKTPTMSKKGFPKGKKAVYDRRSSETSGAQSTPVVQRATRSLSHSESSKLQESTIRTPVSKKKSRTKSLVMLVGNKRFRISAKILSEIKKYQLKTNMLIPKLPFSKLIHEILSERAQAGTRVQRLALEALQELAEAFLTQYFEDSYRCALHAQRFTLIPRDMDLVKWLRHQY